MHLPIKFLITFLQIFLPIVLAKDKNPKLLPNIRSLDSTEYPILYPYVN